MSIRTIAWSTNSYPEGTRGALTSFCMRARRAAAILRRAAPSLVRVTGVTTSLRTAARTSSWAANAIPLSAGRYGIIGFNRAPAGTVPAVTKRHNAISSLRASATMPMRCTRAEPCPKRVWYHCARALSG